MPKKMNDEPVLTYPIYSLLRYDEINHNQLDRDFTWVGVECKDFGKLCELLHVVRPLSGIISMRLSGRDEKLQVHVMSRLNHYDLITAIEKAIGRDFVSENLSFHRLSSKQIPKNVLFQLLINSLATNEFADASNTEGRFYKVVKSEKTRDIEDAIGKHIALEFRVVNAPSCLHSMSDLNLEYNVVTFNNTKRNGINWGKKGKDAHTRYRYVPGVGMQTVDRGYDGDTYVTRSCIFDNKSHIDMLDYTPSTTKGDSKHRLFGGSIDIGYVEITPYIKKIR